MFCGNLKKIIQKIFIIALTLTFCLNDCVYAQSLNFSNSKTLEDLPLSFSDLKLPTEMGQISDYGEGDPDQPMVIAILNAHAVNSAQEKIQKIIEYFQEKHGVQWVGTEGAQGQLDPLLLKSFPMDEVKRKILSKYQTNGEITGSESAAIFSSFESDYDGLEDWKTYEENYLFYLSAIQVQEALSLALQEKKAILNSVTEKQLSAPQKNLLAFSDKLKALQPDLKEILLGLFKIYTQELGRDEKKLNEEYSQLRILKEAYRQEDLHNDKQRVQLKAYIDIFEKKLLHTLSDEREIKLNASRQKHAIGQIDDLDWLLELKQLSKQNKDFLFMPSDLEALLTDRQKIKELEGLSILREFEMLIDEIKNALFVSDVDQSIYDQHQNFSLLESLIFLRMNRAEWLSLKQNDEIFRSLFDPEIYEELKKPMSFYESAEKRDSIFLNNIEKHVKQKKLKKAVVVTGGFHQKGLVEGFKRAGYSYAIINPQIDSLDGQENYSSVMKGNVSYQEEKGASYYESFMKYVIKDLMMSVPTQDSVDVMRQWRDEIIRLLAKEGRLTDTHQYTSYIDGFVEAFQQDAMADKNGVMKKEAIVKAIRKELNPLFNQKIEDAKKDFFEKFNLWKSNLSNDFFKQGSVDKAILTPSLNQKAVLEAALVLAPGNRYFRRHPKDLLISPMQALLQYENANSVSVQKSRAELRMTTSNAFMTTMDQVALNISAVTQKQVSTEDLIQWIAQQSFIDIGSGKYYSLVRRLQADYKASDAHALDPEIVMTSDWASQSRFQEDWFPNQPDKKFRVALSFYALKGSETFHQSPELYEGETMTESYQGLSVQMNKRMTDDSISLFFVGPYENKALERVLKANGFFVSKALQNSTLWIVTKTKPREIFEIIANEINRSELRSSSNKKKTSEAIPKKKNQQRSFEWGEDEVVSARNYPLWLQSAIQEASSALTEAKKLYENYQMLQTRMGLTIDDNLALENFDQAYRAFFRLEHLEVSLEKFEELANLFEEFFKLEKKNEALRSAQFKDRVIEVISRIPTSSKSMRKGKWQINRVNPYLPKIDALNEYWRFQKQAEEDTQIKVQMDRQISRFVDAANLVYLFLNFRLHDSDDGFMAEFKAEIQRGDVNIPQGKKMKTRQQRREVLHQILFREFKNNGFLKNRKKLSFDDRFVQEAVDYYVDEVYPYFSVLTGKLDEDIESLKTYSADSSVFDLDKHSEEKVESKLWDVVEVAERIHSSNTDLAWSYRAVLYEVLLAVSVTIEKFPKIKLSLEPYMNRAQVYEASKGKKYYALNKPQFILSTQHDDHGNRKTVFDLLEEKQIGIDRYDFFSLGRLDYDVDGLMILTNDAESDLMMFPATHIEKHYRVVLSKNSTGLEDNQFSEQSQGRLERGVDLETEDRRGIGAIYKTKPARIIVEKNTQEESIVHLYISEGKYHQVKKMFEKVGFPAIRLSKVGMEGLELSNMALESGKFEQLTGTSLMKLLEIKTRALKNFDQSLRLDTVRVIHQLFATRDNDSLHIRALGRKKILELFDNPEMHYFLFEAFRAAFKWEDKSLHRYLSTLFIKGITNNLEIYDEIKMNRATRDLFLKTFIYVLLESTDEDLRALQLYVLKHAASDSEFLDALIDVMVDSDFSFNRQGLEMNRAKTHRGERASVAPALLEMIYEKRGFKKEATGFAQDRHELRSIDEEIKPLSDALAKIIRETSSIEKDKKLGEVYEIYEILKRIDQEPNAGNLLSEFKRAVYNARAIGFLRSAFLSDDLEVYKNKQEKMGLILLGPDKRITAHVEATIRKVEASSDLDELSTTKNQDKESGKGVLILKAFFKRLQAKGLRKVSWYVHGNNESGLVFYDTFLSQLEGQGMLSFEKFRSISTILNLVLYSYRVDFLDSRSELRANMPTSPLAEIYVFDADLENIKKFLTKTINWMMSDDFALDQERKKILANYREALQVAELTPEGYRASFSKKDKNNDGHWQVLLGVAQIAPLLNHLQRLRMQNANAADTLFFDFIASSLMREAEGLWAAQQMAKEFSERERAKEDLYNEIAKTDFMQNVLMFLYGERNLDQLLIPFNSDQKTFIEDAVAWSLAFEAHESKKQKEFIDFIKSRNWYHEEAAVFAASQTENQILGLMRKNNLQRILSEKTLKKSISEEFRSLSLSLIYGLITTRSFSISQVVYFFYTLMQIKLGELDIAYVRIALNSRLTNLSSVEQWEIQASTIEKVTETMSRIEQARKERLTTMRQELRASNYSVLDVRANVSEKWDAVVIAQEITRAVNSAKANIQQRHLELAFPFKSEKTKKTLLGIFWQDQGSHAKGMIVHPSISPVMIESTGEKKHAGVSHNRLWNAYRTNGELEMESQRVGRFVMHLDEEDIPTDLSIVPRLIDQQSAREYFEIAHVIFEALSRIYPEDIIKNINLQVSPRDYLEIISKDFRIQSKLKELGEAHKWTLNEVAKLSEMMDFSSRNELRSFQFKDWNDDVELFSDDEELLSELRRFDQNLVAFEENVVSVRLQRKLTQDKEHMSDFLERMIIPRISINSQFNKELLTEEEWLIFFEGLQYRYDRNLFKREFFRILKDILEKNTNRFIEETTLPLTLSDELLAQLRWFLAPKNVKILEAAYLELRGEKIDLSLPANIMMDAFFFERAEMEVARELIARLMVNGTLSLAYEKGSETKIGVKEIFRTSGMRRQVYQRKDKVVKIPISEDTDYLYVLLEGVKLSDKEKMAQSAGATSTKSLFYASGLNVSEWLGLVQMVLKIDYLKEQLQESDGFPRITEEVINSFLNLINELANTRVAREAILSAA